MIHIQLMKKFNHVTFIPTTVSHFFRIGRFLHEKDFF